MDRWRAQSTAAPSKTGLSRARARLASQMVRSTRAHTSTGSDTAAVPSRAPRASSRSECGRMADLSSRRRVAQIPVRWLLPSCTLRVHNQRLPTPSLLLREFQQVLESVRRVESSPHGATKCQCPLGGTAILRGRPQGRPRPVPASRHRLATVRAGLNLRALAVAWRKVAPCTLHRPLTWRARAGVTVHTHGEGEGDLLHCWVAPPQGLRGPTVSLSA